MSTPNIWTLPPTPSGPLRQRPAPLSPRTRSHMTINFVPYGDGSEEQALLRSEEIATRTLQWIAESHSTEGQFTFGPSHVMYSQSPDPTAISGKVIIRAFEQDMITGKKKWSRQIEREATGHFSAECTLKDDGTGPLHVYTESFPPPGNMYKPWTNSQQLFSGLSPSNHQPPESASSYVKRVPTGYPPSKRASSEATYDSRICIVLPSELPPSRRGQQINNNLSIAYLVQRQNFRSGPFCFLVYSIEMHEFSRGEPGSAVHLTRRRLVYFAVKHLPAER